MNMPEMKNKIKDIGSMELCSSMDLGMKVRRKDDPCFPVKSASVHLGCHIPLVKLAIVLLISVTALCTVCAIRHARRDCCDCDD